MQEAGNACSKVEMASFKLFIRCEYFELLVFEQYSTSNTFEFVAKTAVVSNRTICRILIIINNYRQSGVLGFWGRRAKLSTSSAKPRGSQRSSGPGSTPSPSGERASANKAVD